MGEEACSYFCVGVERQYKVCYFGLRGETYWSPKQTCQLPSVWFPAVAQIHRKGLRHSRKLCVNSLSLSLSLWPYAYFPQTSPSKNKNINYVLIYQRDIRCLSSGTIYSIHIASLWMRWFLLAGRVRIEFTSSFLWE